MIKVKEKENGLYEVSTEHGFIGTVLEKQLERAKEILEIDPYGDNFYQRLIR